MSDDKDWHGMEAAQKVISDNLNLDVGELKVNAQKSITVPPHPLIDNPDYEYIPPVAVGYHSFLPSGFVPKGGYQVQFVSQEEFITKTQVEKMIAESENRILDILRKSYGQYFL